MKRLKRSVLLITTLVVFSLGGLFAQTIGDYRSNNASFSWTTLGSWQRWNGASWAVPTAPQGYPGQSATPTTVTIRNGHTVTLDVSPANNIGSLVIGGGASGTLTIGNNVTARTLTVNNSITVNNGATFNTGSTSFAHIVNVGGDVTVAGTMNLNNGGTSGATLTFTGGANKLISGTATTLTVYNFSITGSGTVSFGNNTNVRTLNINNDLTISAGAFQSGSTAAIAHDINIRRNLINDGGIIDFSANSATNHSFNFTNASAKLIAGLSSSTATFYNLTLASGTVSFGDNTTNRTINIVNDFTISSGAFQSGSTAAIAHTINLSRNFTNNGGTLNLTANSATNHTFNFTGASAQSITGTSTTPATFYNLGVSTGTVTFGNNSNTRTITINNDFVVSSGTFQSGSTAAVAHTINLSRNLTNNGGTIDFTANSATNHTFNFTGATDKSIDGTSTTTATFYNLGIATGTVSFGDNANARTIDINNDLVISSGTFQSGNTAAQAHTINLTRNLTNNGGTLDFTANSATNHTFTFTGAGSKTILGSSTTTGTFFNFTIADGTVSYGNSGNARTLTVTNDFSISSTGVFQAGNSAAQTHTLRLGGNVVNDGTFNQTASANTGQLTTFIGSANNSLSGSGTFAFRILDLNTISSSNVNINQNISISTTLSFSANGLLVIGANANITISATATISGNNSSRYVQLDGSTGANSQFVRLNSGSTAQWAMTYPIGTSTGGYTPLVIPTVTITPTNGSSLSVKAIYNGSTIGQMRRTFRLVVTGNAAATTFQNAQFNYSTSTDISSGDVQANYNTIWYLPLSTAVWTTLTGTAPGVTFFTAPSVAQTLQTGTYYYTIGNASAYPTTWYSYQSGVWSNPDVWTQDPSGTNLINPLTQIPAPGDQVVILNGFTVTADINTITTGTMEIQGGATLDLSTTTGHNLGAVSGAGILRMNGVSLPTGTYTNFVAASGGGTIEYYNTGGTLPVGQTTYNKLLLSNTTGSAITYVTANNLTINSTLNITQTSGAGTVTWQINDASNVQRTISITGDVTVSANGQIRVGTGNSGSATPHAVTLSGNFTNNGSVKFFDVTDATYSDANYTSGAVWTSSLRGNTCSVTFSGTVDKLLTLNSLTDFYRLIVNKGTGQQAILEVNSSATANFRLFGPNNRGSSGAAPNASSNNSLSIVNGTLKLSGNINITNLVEGGGSYPIPQNGALWMNGSGVTIQTTSNNVGGGGNSRMIIDYGLLRITNGTLNMGYSRGLLGGQSGQFVIEGGTVNTWQFRTTNLGTGNNFAYTQSGGTVNVATAGLNGETIDGYARFSLPYSTSTFRMSGGVLNVARPITGATTINGGIGINANTSNISVTGGTVNCYIPTDGSNFGIASNAGFYNLNVLDQGGTGSLTLSNIAINDGVSGFTITAVALQIVNNLTIVTGNSPILNCNNLNLLVGGNFDIQTGTTFTPGTNTITFNGSGAQSWTHNGTITSLNNVVLNKSAGTLTLGGAQTFPNMVGLTLTSGTLADGGKTLTVTSALSNSATHSGAGAIVANGPTTIGGSGGTFGNLTLQTNSTIATSGTQTITGTLRLINANTTLNIASYGLSVLGNIYSDAATGVAFTSTKRVLTNGLRNDSGLSRAATSGVDLLFPVGSSTLYTPATINTTATTTGIITVRPVNSAHPTVTTTSQSVRYFWRITSTGFSGISSVVHKSYTYSSATRDAASTTYRPARYDPVTFTWAYQSPATYDATIPTGTTTIPDFNTASGWLGLATTQLDGEYTAGNSSAFGSVTVYYSRQSGPWNLTSTWSNIGVGNATPASTAPPCATCPVIIGDGASNNHSITIDANNRSAGSLFIAAGSILDCDSFTGLNFGVNTSGTGTLRISSTAATGAFPAGDFTDFIGSGGGTVEWYSVANAFAIPIVGPAPQNLNLVNYKNLIVNTAAGAGGIITLPATNLTIYNDFTKTGPGTLNTEATGVRTISINGNMNISSGVLSIRNGNVTNFNITGNTTNDGTINLQGGGTRTHTFTTQGDITNNGVLTFVNGAEVVNLTINGTSNTSITGTGAGGTTLNLLTVNKGTSQSPVLTFDVAGTVTTLSNNWLTLSNGTINFNKTGGTFTLTNAAATTYTIPSTAKLKVNSGTVNISNVAANNSDLSLAGAIEVSGNGTLNVGSSANNNNNDIEYASAGTPTINILETGVLYVNGAIRRQTTTIAGALVFSQTGGTVTVAGRNTNGAPNNTRGVFEIENNSGSSFTLTGTSIFKVSRSTGGASFTDLYLKPVTSSVASTTTVQIGDNTLGVQTLSFNSIPTLGNVTVLGATGNAQTVNMVSSTLSAAGTLTINQASTLNTNALDVSIGGDLSINTSGTYNGGANTTTFNGAGAQAGSLSATSSFFNMTVNKSSGTVSLSGTAPTINNLNILSGVLDVGSMALQVNANIVNNSSQIGSGSIVMFGAAATHSITSSNGSFTNLTLGGAAATKNVTVTGNMTINGTLNFATTNRYLTIGSNLLTFGTSGAITGSGNTAFIRTSGSTGDLGITKTWDTGISSFTYAMGTINNYTPVFYDLNVSVSGTLNVIAVNDRHPTAVGSEQTLNYYWIVNRSAGLTATMNASHTYSFPSTLMGGSGGSLLAGYLNISSPTGWVTSGHGGSATTSSMTYLTAPSSNFPSAGIVYHYSVGTAASLPNPIVPVYSRLADANVSSPTGGNWNSVNSWTTQSDGMGAPVGAAPTGIPVTILPGATINLNVNGRSSFATTVNGTISLGTSFGHGFGTITGTGTLKTATNVFPSGNYNAFVASGGGTIEYVGPMTMNSRSTYNNLTLSGSGTVTMTNTDLTLNGSMTIGSGITLDNTANNRDITLAGNWNNNGGTFSAGTGTVTFNGTAGQTMSGTNTFNDLTISTTSGNVTLSGAGTTTVNDVLTLTSGHIVSSGTHGLSLGLSASISGGSATSFISGPVCKIVSASGTFLFPLGSVAASKYRPATIGTTSALDTWCTEYVGSNPNGFYPITSMTGALQKVSQFEYWNISRSGATSADVTITYGTGSYIGADVGNVSNLRLAHWNSGSSVWEEAGTSTLQSGTNVAGTITALGVSSFSPVTAGSLDADSPLPIQLTDFTATQVENKVELRWVTKSELNNDYFNIEHLNSGDAFESIGVVKGKGTTNDESVYSVFDYTPNDGKNYYRLKQTDFSGRFSYSEIRVVEFVNNGASFEVYPNPATGRDVTIILRNLKPSEEVPVQLTNAVGISQFKRVLAADETGKITTTIPTTHFAPGVYIIQAGEKGVMKKKIVIE